MKLENIEFLINGYGTIRLGGTGHVPCAAIATNEVQLLVALARDADETLPALLRRLDKALGDVLNGGAPVDEINGMPYRPAGRSKRTKRARPL